MNWMEQSQNMLQSWMDSTQQLWKTWSDNMGDQAPDASWDRVLRTWENSFKNLIETQALWTRSWARNMMNGVDGEQSAAFVKAVEDSTKMWTDMQLTMWQSWSTMMKQFDPTQMSENMNTEGHKMMEAWQEQMQKMMDMQAKWSKQMMDMMQPKDD
jgi:hypothetical protein